MVIKRKVLFLLGIIIVMNSILFVLNTQTNSLEAHKNKQTVFSSNYNYQWIWDEYIGAEGPIEGNDVVNWSNGLGSYHNRTELWEKLISLNFNFPSIVDLSVIGLTHKGNLIPIVILTDESSNVFKKEFFVVAHHHAREMITVENALYYIDKLVFEFINNNTEIQNIFANRIIYVIPSLNIDSLDIMHLRPGQRKNLHPIDEDGDGVEDENEWITGVDSDDPDETIGEDNPGGVDLNRNYAFKWDYPAGSSDNPLSLLYRGTEAFSELETTALANFVRKHHFQAAVSLHSGVEMVLTPWAYEPNILCPDQTLYNEIGNQLADLTGLLYADLYHASGEWGDFMYAHRGIIAITLETYEGDNWTYIWDGFNPPANEVIANCRDVAYPGLLYLTTFDRPDMNIAPVEDISTVISKPPPSTQESSLSIISVVISTSSIMTIIVIKRKRKN
jgi:hypothetical protein